MKRILEDTRQQQYKHKNKREWFIKNGIPMMREKLSCGDYQIDGQPGIAVDTKKDILELIGDIQFKTIPKKEVKERLAKIDGVRESDAQELYEIICCDDSERFPELEIDMYCNSNGIPENSIMKLKELYEKRHGFFHRGLVRAKNRGVKLYILVENEDGVSSISELFSWTNPRSLIKKRTSEVLYMKGKIPVYKKVSAYPNAMSGMVLAKSCLTMQKKYGCEFVFCNPKQAGEMVWKLLNGITD